VDDPLTLEQTAELVAGHAEVEQELFRLTGFWSTDGSSSGAPAGLAAHSQALFAAESAHHGWRAEQWRTRVVRSVDPADSHDSMDPMVAAVAGFLEDELDPLARLAVWGHVLAPTLAGRYLGHRRGLAPAADGGLDRWLGICIADLQRGATEAVALVGTPRSGVSVGTAADAVRTALERVVGS
jgi:hypothetical protein